MEQERLEGLGGWLIPVHIMLYMNVAFNASTAISLIGLVNLFASWREASVIIYTVLLSLFSVFVLVKLYQRDKLFPLSAVVTIWVSPFYVFLFPLFILPGELIRLLLLYAIWGVAWTLYFVRSKRVRNTFVR